MARFKKNIKKLGASLTLREPSPKFHLTKGVLVDFAFLLRPFGIKPPC